MPGPLADVRVVEIAAGGGGGGLPLAAMLLGDMGADVIRVDRIGSRRGQLGPLTALRGRRSIAVDLSTAAGREVVVRLCQISAVLVEGFRPGAAEAMGIGPDTCCAANPALVYGRLSGMGQHGPRARQAGHDLNFLATAGVLDGPALAATSTQRPLTTIADRGAPALLFAFGVVCALIEARRSGRGQVVDCASVDAALVTAARFGATDDPAAQPPAHLGAPYYGVYPTRDGQYMAVAAVDPERYQVFLAGLGLRAEAPAAEAPAAEALASQHDQASWPRVRALVAAEFARHDAAHWEAVFARLDACVTSVRSPTAAHADPQLRARGSFTQAGGRWEPTAMPLLSRTPGAPAGPPSAPGAHTREILGEAGYLPAEIDALVAGDVVRAAAAPPG